MLNHLAGTRPSATRESLSIPAGWEQRVSIIPADAPQLYCGLPAHHEKRPNRIAPHQPQKMCFLCIFYICRHQINLVINAVTKALLDDSYELTLGMKPLPLEGELELKFQMFQNHRVGFLIGMFVGMGYAIYASSVVHFLLWERQSGVKHMQAISGVSLTMFWVPTFLWDACSFIVPTVLLFLLIHYAGNRAFIEDGNWALCLLAVFLFVWAILPIMYAVHFAFDSAAQGLAGILVCNLFSVLLANIVVFELTRPETDTEDLGWWVKLTAMLLIPTFNLSECFKSIMINYHSEKLCGYRQDACMQGYNSLCCVNHPDLCYSDISDEKCYEWFESYLDMDITKGIGLCLVLLVIHGFLGWIVVCAVEISLVQRFYLVGSRAQNAVTAVSIETSSETQEEDDVTAERERINWQLAALQRGSKVSDPLLLANLKKRYGRVRAVNGLSLGVTSNQCFGLLGQSGAGKTTVFRMLTGQTSITSGNAYLNCLDVKTNLRGVQSQIGYCPQYDAHIGELTGIEILHLYGRLRGIPPRDLGEIVKTLVKIALLGPHANRRCGNYRSGNVVRDDERVGMGKRNTKYAGIPRQVQSPKV
ncbi:ATP-binding cassette sub-family A member 3 [Elysia marginata]|uniref:ATP-binding cassette sub-family A member 3 n=1 Tax=Elysia marginata TaxID=1093978 RepID=A0AAV4EI73_9GAST|nr:ATP-binding cassette sub-family A member 3 [Elysia marginata]